MIEQSSIILNRIQCNHCFDVITSHHRHDFVTCSCGVISCDGGRAYLKRGYSAASSDGSLPYTELSITSTAPFEELREALYRGSRGKNGDELLKWVPLCNTSDSYLANLLAYQESGGYTASIDYKLQKQEQQYRIDNNIVISE